MRVLIMKLAIVLIPAMVVLAACSDGREDEVMEEAEATVSDPDGQLGAPTDGEPTADSSVVNPPDLTTEGEEEAGLDFVTLDQNDDGYLRSDEVENNQLLKDNWESLDRNDDGQLDATEFAKFEARQDGNTER